MQKNDGLHAKNAVKFGCYVACAVALSTLGACVQIVGMDDPTLVDRLDEPSGSGAGGNGSGSNSSGSGSVDPPATGSSSNSSSGNSTGSAPNAWADWPMPNPTSAQLPNPSSYSGDSVSAVVKDLVTKLEWQGSVQMAVFSFAGATAYCESLDYGGFSDWRLPSRIELVSLVDYTQSNPAIDPTAFPGTPAAAFWTSSPKVSFSMSEAWTVDFASGATASTELGTMLQVRCVR
jgi:hypothetical protein